MVEPMQVLGIRTDLISPGEDLVDKLQEGMKRFGLELQDGDILVVSESAVATWEGRIARLPDINPSHRAQTLAVRFSKDPQEMELILRESDRIVGGIPGVVLTLKDGFLYPNAGIDRSNAPDDCAVLLPVDPQASAAHIRRRIAPERCIGVIIGDSRTHPLRLGCVGVALGCDGVVPVEDARGQKDLYGRELRITRKAVADNLVSAAQLVMGEGDEGIPAVIIRGAPVNVAGPDTGEDFSVPVIAPAECMYIGAMTSGFRPYRGEYPELLTAARKAMEAAYAPYSGFRVGAALLCGSGKVYAAGNVENASSGVGVCAERAAIMSAMAAGERDFLVLAVLGGHDEPLPPCGICRQTMIEFNRDMLIIMASMGGNAEVATANELLPHPFTREHVP